MASRAAREALHADWSTCVIQCINRVRELRSMCRSCKRVEASKRACMVNRWPRVGMQLWHPSSKSQTPALLVTCRFQGRSLACSSLIGLSMCRDRPYAVGSLAVCCLQLCSAGSLFIQEQARMHCQLGPHTFRGGSPAAAVPPNARLPWPCKKSGLGDPRPPSAALQVYGNKRAVCAPVHAAAVPDC